MGGTNTLEGLQTLFKGHSIEEFNKSSIVSFRHSPKQAVYVICDPHGSPLYVGQTNNLSRRFNAHNIWIDPNTRIYCLFSDSSAEAYSMERELIVKLQPLRNTRIPLAANSKANTEMGMGKFMTINEAVEYMKISKPYFYKLARAGKLKVIKPSRKKTLVDIDDIHKFMETYKRK